MTNFVKQFFTVGNNKPTLNEILNVFTQVAEHLEDFKKDQTEQVAILEIELKQATEDLVKATKVSENIKKLLEN